MTKMANPAQRFSSRLTARHIINVGVVILALASIVAQRYGFQPLADYGFDAASCRNMAVAFCVGAFWPGSPIGPVLDYIASQIGGPPAPPPTVAQLTAAFRAIKPPPQEVPPSAVPVAPGPRPVRVLHDDALSAEATSRGWVSPVLLVALSGALALGGCAMLMHGCGASPLRAEAVVADVSGSTLDAACQEVLSARTHAEADAAAAESPSLGTDFVAQAHAHYAPAVAACNLIADATDAWDDELQRAAAAKLAGQPYTLDVALAERVLSSWPDVAAALSSVGVSLPGPAKDLLQFVGGAQ